ncbi:MAG TPA: PA0069 family radical SAM protein [Geminicoccaceae bacterium]|nr:PA0069 family radical SAM protein [Geminicoccus sp.]HMU48622.1 PA0069 family radical SAM protein [Geminicoccaceae bacterium]
MAVTIHKGRGALSNPAGRFEAAEREAFDDGWGSLEELALDPSPETRTIVDRTRSIIATNDSPDIGFDRSINPYRGCEHGCVYCYARPTHAFLGLSSGLDFETRIFVKPEAAKLLRAELARPGYRPATLALGSNTDPYQPLERRLRITREVLEVLHATRHPVGIVTKSALVVRDIDLLAPMSALGLARVWLSVTTLDAELARKLEPRASQPMRRLDAVRRLTAAGVTSGVMVAPVIPVLTDHELERLVAAAAEAGAVSIGHTLVRLPYEVKELMTGWLRTHYPQRADHVLSLIRQCRDGKLNDAEFGSRFRGKGVYAELIAQRFARAMERHGLQRRLRPQRTDLFRPPRDGAQLSLELE